MGSHTWQDTCLCCGYPDVLGSTDGADLSMLCPACGWNKYTTEDVPDEKVVQAIKEKLAGMSKDELDALYDQTEGEGTSLAERLGLLKAEEQPLHQVVIFIQGGLVAGLEASTELEYMVIDRDVYGHDQSRALKDETGEEFEAGVEMGDATLDAKLVAHYFSQI